jgi:polyphosphate kinase
VEALVRLPGAPQVEEVGRLLDLAFDDGTASWLLEPSGAWVRRAYAEDGSALRDMQEVLIHANRRGRRS